MPSTIVANFTFFFIKDKKGINVECLTANVKFHSNKKIFTFKGPISMSPWEYFEISSLRSQLACVLEKPQSLILLIETLFLPTTTEAVPTKKASSICSQFQFIVYLIR